jgi:Leucine-rich repeat (LRR) protein
MERQELLRLIDEAAADQRQVLDLSFRGLTEIPEAISKLQSLTSLDLGGNQISEIPEAISRLQNLTRLYLSDNIISEIPQELSSLYCLTDCDLSGNLVNTIPQWMRPFPHLYPTNKIKYRAERSTPE